MMLDFFKAAGDNTLLANALLAALITAVPSGIVGGIIVTRRISIMAGGIAHFLLAGIGVARYLEVTRGWVWLHPLLGATIAAVFAAFAINLLGTFVKERLDTVIAALWAVGMAVGLLFLAVTPGYAADLMSYLFGNILMASRSELWMSGLLAVGMVAVMLIAYRRMNAVCFDEEFARVRELNADALNLLMLLMAALTVVALVTVVGIVLALALLVIPAATAGRFARTLGGMMVAAVLICAVTSVGGLALSYDLDLPAGPVIIVFASGIYLVAAAFKVSWGGFVKIRSRNGG